MNLTDVHTAQVSRFTTFFKGKREGVLSDREGEKNDFISDRLVDESAIFNYTDVQGLLEAYHAQVMACFRDELEKTVNLSAVFVAQLLAQAEAAGMNLQVADISVIEDQSRLGQVAALPAVTAPPLAPKPKPALAAVEGGGVTDPSVLQDLQDLREENRTLKERNMQLQGGISEALKERSGLSSELDQVKSTLASMQAAGGGGDAFLTQQLNATKAELDTLKQELNQRLGDSTQFKELKSIVKKKTAENKDLKQRMAAAGLAPPDDGQGIELAADSD